MQLRFLLLRFLLLIGALCVLSVRPVLAQTAPVLGASSAPSSFDPVGLAPDDAALRAPITLDATRMPLAQLASKLSNTAKTTITLPPELAARPITAHLEKQPLSETMRSLSRLYGLEWQKVAGGYSAKVAATPLERDVLRAGDLSEWQGRTSTRVELQTIATQVLTQVPRASLEKEEGVSLSQVPGLTEQLKRNRQMDLALSLIQDWSATSPFLLRSCFVRLALIPPQAGAPAPPPRFIVEDTTGCTVADLGAVVAPKVSAVGAK